MRAEINRLAQKAVNEAEDCARAGGGKAVHEGTVAGLPVKVTIEVGAKAEKPAPAAEAPKPRSGKKGKTNG